MASTSSPRTTRTEDGSNGSRQTGDRKIAAPRQPTPLRTTTMTDPRSEEARRRSADVQAAIDIAAGW